jgi:hypothetical protein
MQLFALQKYSIFLLFSLISLIGFAFIITFLIFSSQGKEIGENFLSQDFLTLLRIVLEKRPSEVDSVCGIRSFLSSHAIFP